MARLGVNGFGSFSRKKMTSSAGAKPGNAKNRLEIVLDKQVRDFIAINGKLRIYETKDGFTIKMSRMTEKLHVDFLGVEMK